MPLFLSTLSLRRATQVGFTGVRQHAISIHALLAESDGNHNNSVIHCCKFLSTLSLRRATNINSSVTTADKISIHALLAESDAFLPADRMNHQRFLSTLSLRRATCKIMGVPVPGSEFLSTLSLRRATLEACSTAQTAKFLSTLSLRRATDELGDRLGDYCISIHALLAESDREAYRQTSLSHRISIHALLAESDRNTKNNYTDYCDFYPRSPCGERPTRSASSLPSKSISIHALLAESDLILHMAHLKEHLFLSTLSLRRATFFRHKKTLQGFNFYPRSPCGERP